LERGLRAEFPSAVIARDNATLRPWVAEITAHFDGRQPDLDLPLDLRATAFQRRVWEALRKIPYGSTSSYSAIARAIGKPRATRARRTPAPREPVGPATGAGGRVRSRTRSRRRAASARAG